jgi:hypothetical protein
MRDLIVTAIVCAVIFFGVGEWRGWYLGVPSQTPVFVYKKDHVANASRRTINLDHLPLDVSGKVQQGKVTVSVYFERPFSYQTGQQPQAETKVFEQSFGQGQRVMLRQDIARGEGIYRIELAFEDATGLFKVRLPTTAAL